MISSEHEFYVRAQDFYRRHIEELVGKLVVCLAVMYKLNARWLDLPDQRNRHNSFGLGYFRTCSLITI